MSSRRAASRCDLVFSGLVVTAEEDNFFGKHTGYEPNPHRMAHPMMEAEFGKFDGWPLAASGLAAVYATENTRGAIFDAFEFAEQDVNSRAPAFAGYSKGVPMGANVDRIQIVKGWMDGSGNAHEMVPDVAWSGDQSPAGDGKLPPVALRPCDARRTQAKPRPGSPERGFRLR